MIDGFDNVSAGAELLPVVDFFEDVEVDAPVVDFVLAGPGVVGVNRPRPVDLVELPASSVLTSAVAEEASVALTETFAFAAAAAGAAAETSFVTSDAAAPIAA